MNGKQAFTGFQKMFPGLTITDEMFKNYLKLIHDYEGGPL